MVVSALVIWLSLTVDRLFGDPPNFLHPVAYLGKFIGWWGRPELYPPSLQRTSGVLFTIITAVLFALPFWLFESYAPLILIIIAGPFLLKICLSWRCLEEHVESVITALGSGTEEGQKSVRMLVSRDTSLLGDEEVLSAAYESMAETLVDSIISPLFFFTFFGFAGAAFFRAVNTMDAMLGYRDKRLRLGWFPARLDDLLNYIPARLAGLILLLYFAAKGRFSPAWKVFCSDRKKRPGFNGGIPMSIIAGGTGIRFTKPGSYEIGEGERSLKDFGHLIVAAVRAATVLSALLFTLIIFCIWWFGHGSSLMIFLPAV